MIISKQKSSFSFIFIQEAWPYIKILHFGIIDGFL